MYPWKKSGAFIAKFSGEVRTKMPGPTFWTSADLVIGGETKEMAQRMAGNLKKVTKINEDETDFIVVS